MSLINGLNDLKARFEQMGRFQTEDALKAALNLAAAMKSRVQQEGLNSNEQKFEGYTPDYAERRKKAGYQVEQFDFTRTNQTMASVGPVVVASSATEVVVEIRSSTAEGQNRINGAFKKRGNIIANTQEEIDDAGREFATYQTNRLL